MTSWDTDNFDNRYPYCAKNTDFYSNSVLNYNYRDRGSNDCPLYMHMTPNYPVCQANYGGFLTPTYDDSTDEGLTPTEENTELMYTQLE